MNFHSNGYDVQENIDLRNSKKTSKDERNKPLLFRNKKPEVSSERKQTFKHESLILAQDERWRRA